MRKKRAQMSAEFLYILGISLLVLLIFITVSQNQGSDINRAKTESEAKHAIADIAGAAKEVYAQGLGAKKKVYVTIPSGVEANKTMIANNTIRLHALGEDYVGMENFDMHGTLPVSEGGQWVWVVSEGNKVRIGNAMVALSRQSIYVAMKPDENATKELQVQNVWGGPINVTFKWDPEHDRVYTNLKPGIASIGEGHNESFSISFASVDTAVGFYLSEIELIANDKDSSEYIRIPVIVQVMSDKKERPPLTAIPPVYRASLNWSESVYRLFQICTNEYTSVTSVDFTASEASPGSWAGGLDSLGPIDYDSCVEKVLSINIPIGTVTGNYTGYINLVGNGAADAEDSIALDIFVGGSTDNEGPDVYNITTSKRRVHVGEPTTILAIADDTDRGNSTISGCEIRADNETKWIQMYPEDVFDSPIEHVYYNYTKGFSMGIHTVYLRCTDQPGNIGPIKEYNFTIGKHILFVTDSNESDWSNWVTVHKSDMGYSWDFDVSSTDEVKDGTTDLYFYDAVIFIDWDRDADFVNKVLEYQSLGGYVGMFGDSAHLAVRDLDVAWHPDNPHPESGLNILDNTHYVTQGFPMGVLDISSVLVKSYSVWWANTTELGASGWFYPSTDRIVLGEVNKTLFWGPEDPWKLNENGVTISTRVIDYMINNSEVS
jgi:uncharacterized protein (UPF0333 family)